LIYFSTLPWNFAQIDISQTSNLGPQSTQFSAVVKESLIYRFLTYKELIYQPTDGFGPCIKPLFLPVSQHFYSNISPLGFCLSFQVVADDDETKPFPPNSQNC
jgi:hypothetical protein